jgi:hypothetical protein
VKNLETSGVISGFDLSRDSFLVLINKKSLDREIQNDLHHQQIHHYLVCRGSHDENREKKKAEGEEEKKCAHD